jgi:hypothetical protein
MRFWPFLRLTSTLVLGAVIVSGQVGTSTITGLVTDPSGAVVVGVDVTVVNAETNFTFTAKTNTDGLYRVPSLQAGTLPYHV